MNELKCLGVDPGLGIIGWAFLQGMEVEHPNLLDYGTIETDKSISTPARLTIIENDLVSLISEFKPNLIAVEMPFFSREIKAAGGVLQAVGVINLVCYREGKINPIMLHQSSWKSHLGNGKAKKAEVAEIVQSLFDLRELPIDDTVDAIAIAYAAFCGLRNNIN
jgi:crossover junction endodeoxyribonuclease RuvC